MSELRCASNLKNLGSDKAEFKNWNERLVNVMSQAFGPEWRTFMRNLNKRLDVDRKIIPKNLLDKIEGLSPQSYSDRIDEELYHVLVEKSEGEAALRVNSGKPGSGLEAYQRIYLWFAGTSGLAITERTKHIMHPNPPKHESEIADALERWCESERLLSAHGDEYRMPAAYKITALQILMTCRREQFEMMERECKTANGNKISEATYDMLFE